MASQTGNPFSAALSIPTHTLRKCATILALTMSLVSASELQGQTISISMHDHASDSVAFLVPRSRNDVANAKIRSRDKSVALLLTDTTLILQLTQRGMDRIESEVSQSKDDSGLAARIAMRALGAGLAGFLDHGIAYKLSALRSAHADGSRLVLEDRDGHRVFENMEVNGTHMLEDVQPDEARRFAADVNRAIDRLHR